MEITDIEELAKKTVRQYYNMNENQKRFIKALIDGDDRIGKLELICMLSIYNEATKLKCSIDDSKLDNFVNLVDMHCDFEKLIKKYDKEMKHNGLIC